MAYSTFSYSNNLSDKKNQVPALIMQNLISIPLSFPYVRA